MTTSHSMTLWSQLALGAYYYATLPDRKRRNAARAENGDAPVMVLFYHRVADHSPNDWTISEARFARQIHWLQSNFELISLETAQQRIEQRANLDPAVVITFDDGYADNCRFALPLLIKERIPFTYFVTSQHVLTGEPFPHDVAAGAPLTPNTIDQLRSLVEAGVEIGAHTRTHPDLGKERDPRRLHDEVVGCRDELQAAVGATVRYFAFPYGLHCNLNAEVFYLAREAGFSGVCSAYGGYNFPGDDPFHFQRIHADPELIRLKNWLLVDPRKEQQVARFVYERNVAARHEESPSEWAARAL